MLKKKRGLQTPSVFFVGAFCYLLSELNWLLHVHVHLYVLIVVMVMKKTRPCVNFVDLKIEDYKLLVCFFFLWEHDIVCCHSWTGCYMYACVQIVAMATRTRPPS